jgi:hypothetical protein
MSGAAALRRLRAPSGTAALSRRRAPSVTAALLRMRIPSGTAVLRLRRTPSRLAALPRLRAPPRKEALRWWLVPSGTAVLRRRRVRLERWCSIVGAFRQGWWHSVGCPLRRNGGSPWAVRSVGTAALRGQRAPSGRWAARSIWDGGAPSVRQRRAPSGTAVLGPECRPHLVPPTAHRGPWRARGRVSAGRGHGRGEQGAGTVGRYGVTGTLLPILAGGRGGGSGSEGRWGPARGHTSCHPRSLRA